MLLAFDGESIVNVAILLQMIEDASPNIASLPSVYESLRIPNHDQCIARPRNQNIQAFFLGQKANVVRLVASGERNENNVTFLALIIICGKQLANILSNMVQ